MFKAEEDLADFSKTRCRFFNPSDSQNRSQSDEQEWHSWLQKSSITYMRVVCPTRLGKQSSVASDDNSRQKQVSKKTLNYCFSVFFTSSSLSWRQTFLVRHKQLLFFFSLHIAQYRLSLWGEQGQHFICLFEKSWPLKASSKRWWFKWDIHVRTCFTRHLRVCFVLFFYAGWCAVYLWDI